MLLLVRGVATGQSVRNPKQQIIGSLEPALRSPAMRARAGAVVKSRLSEKCDPRQVKTWKLRARLKSFMAV
jgi:hypothetical protein